MYILTFSLIMAAIGLMGTARLFFAQREMIFRPGRRIEHSVSSLPTGHERVWLSIGNECSVEAWWIPANGASRSVVYFHGSEGNLTHELPVMHYLRRLGLDVLAVEYPGYADSGKPSEEGCYAAARAAWDYLVDRRGLDPDSLILFGISLGGAVAIRLAAERRCAGLVVEGTFTSVPDLAASRYPYLPVRPFVRTRMNSLEQVGRIRVPVLVIHSWDDEHIPIDHARRLAAAASGPTRLLTLRGAHNNQQWFSVESVTTAWRQLITGQVDEWERKRGDWS